MMIDRLPYGAGFLCRLDLNGRNWTISHSKKIASYLCIVDREKRVKL